MSATRRWPLFCRHCTRLVRGHSDVQLFCTIAQHSDLARKIHVCRSPQLRLTEQKGCIPEPKSGESLSKAISGSNKTYKSYFSHAPALKDMYYYQLSGADTVNKRSTILTTTKPHPAIQKCEGGQANRGPASTRPRRSPVQVLAFRTLPAVATLVVFT